MLSSLLRRRLHWTQVIGLPGNIIIIIAWSFLKKHAPARKSEIKSRDLVEFFVCHMLTFPKNHEKSVLPGITYLAQCSGNSLMFLLPFHFGSKWIWFWQFNRNPKDYRARRKSEFIHLLSHWIQGGLIILYALYSRDPNWTNDAIVSPASLTQSWPGLWLANISHCRPLIGRY